MLNLLPATVRGGGGVFNFFFVVGIYSTSGNVQDSECDSAVVCGDLRCGRSTEG